jgi:hypothetical protein
MSKKIHTIQSSDKQEFDSEVNFFLELGFELHDGGYEVIKNNDSVVYSQVVTFDIKKYCVDFYDNGQLRYWGPLDSLFDGRSDGSFRFWNENGQIMEQGAYKDGKRWGLWTWWYENGHKKEEGSWNKNGKVGEWFEWYENATLQKSEIYKEGEKDGRFTYYDKNGKMISDGYYGDGKRYTMYKDDT